MIDKFLCISISKLDDNRYELVQPFLIKRIIEFIESKFPNELNGKQSITPVGKLLFHKYLMGVPRKYGWNYQTAVGVIGYLQQNTRPDISMTNHQCARFVNKPMLSHERAIIRIARYLRSTKERGVIFQTDPKLGLECFVDADFAGFGHWPTQTTQTMLCLTLVTSLGIPVVLLGGAVICKQRLPSTQLRKNIFLYISP